eukprot:1159199-Pelagomonas_calceolata.AAC.2
MHRSCTPGEPLQLLQLPYGGKDNLYFVLVNPVFEAPTKAVGPVFETPKDKAQWQCQSTGFVLILQHPHVGLASVCIWRHAPSAFCGSRTFGIPASKHKPKRWDSLIWNPLSRWHPEWGLAVVRTSTGLRCHCGAGERASHPRPDGRQGSSQSSR